MYGAKLKLIEGNRAATTQAVLEAAATIYYASHNWNPFFLEGTKTIAFEIAEQLGWQAPDHIICPIGFGSVYMGLYMGFGELRAQGIITKLPRLLGVQSAACCPVYRAYSENRSQIERSPQTYRDPRRRYHIGSADRVEYTIMRALRETNGAITTVDEAEIEFGVKALASKGIYVEPTSAVIVKAFDKFVESGIIRAGDITVSILTGSGLKATDKLMKIA